MTEATRAEVCAAAIADAFKDDGEIFASPMGMLPMLGVRLADGLRIDELPSDARTAVAGLVADGLVDGATALGRASGGGRRLVLTRRGRLLADAVVRSLAG